jgi:hypothetical protein
MDIKDGFAISSKEHLRSLVRVHELDEITSNGGKDWSATKEHPRGLKRKRPNFMHGEPPSWREDDSVKIMQVEGAKCIITWGPTGAKGRWTGPRWAWAGRPRPEGPAHSGGRFDPPFLAPEGSSTLKPWRRRHSRHGESHSHQEGDLRGEINHLDGSTHKWRRRKAPSEGKPWSMVLCPAPWWG